MKQDMCETHKLNVHSLLINRTSRCPCWDDRNFHVLPTRPKWQYWLPGVTMKTMPSYTRLKELIGTSNTHFQTMTYSTLRTLMFVLPSSCLSVSLSVCLSDSVSVCFSVCLSQVRDAAWWWGQWLCWRRAYGQHHVPPGSGHLPTVPLVPLQLEGVAPAPTVSRANTATWSFYIRHQLNPVCLPVCSTQNLWLSPRWPFQPWLACSASVAGVSVLDGPTVSLWLWTRIQPLYRMSACLSVYGSVCFLFFFGPKLVAMLGLFRQRSLLPLSLSSHWTCLSVFLPQVCNPWPL